MFWQEHDLYCVCYGQRRNVLIENLYVYDHNIILPLKSTVEKQISEMLMLSCTAMELAIKTVSLLRECPSQFSLLLDVIE